MINYVRGMSIAALVFLWCVISSNAVAGSESYSQQAIEQLKQEYLGQKWLIVLWSVDCPACFKELALISKLRQHYKESTDDAINVVIINTDDNDEVTQQRQQIITQYKLNDLPLFHFNDGQGSKERYQIDPYWYGELPRSYFVDKKGKVYGKSGLLDEAQLLAWLRANK